MIVSIKHRTTGNVLFKSEATTELIALESAVKANANLHGADLRGSDLSGANFCGANLHGADISKADLKWMNLHGADLSGANLHGADLHGADISGADISGADLSGANLHGADLRGADLSGANFCGADLSGADLGGTDLIDAGQDSRGYRFVASQRKGTVWICAGCRWLTLDDASSHWQSAHSNDPELRAECLAKVALIETVARARGWLGVTMETA